MAIPYGDPRKRLWNLMGYTGQGQALPERFWGPSNRMANQPDADSPTGFKAELSGLMGPQYGEGGNAAINAAMARQVQTPASGASSGTGKWDKVLKHLGQMTGPEPDWSLGPQNLGVRSPWSPTNVPWSPISPVPRKKKEGPY